MNLQNLLLLIILFSCFACNSNNQKTIHTSREISESIAEAQKNTIRFEGRFVEIHQINEREYYLSLKNEKDSIETFLTIMPIDEHAIKLLKKEGNNIRLNYTNFYNKVRKKTEKIVKYMEPIYDFGQK